MPALVVGLSKTTSSWCILPCCARHSSTITYLALSRHKYSWQIDYIWPLSAQWATRDHSAPTSSRVLTARIAGPSGRVLSAQSIVDLRYGSALVRIAFGMELVVNGLSIGLDLPVYRVSSVSAWPMSLDPANNSLSREVHKSGSLKKARRGWKHKSPLILQPLNLQHVRARSRYLLYLFP